jgi:murein DD-endopeptidase / murein LD-carboxypeptidase
METLSIQLEFFDSKYDASKYPGSGKCDGLKNGSNCQYFAYELLRHFGYTVPDLRSSDLWEDTEYSEIVNEFEPLDILFFNTDSKSYGAHVGLYIGAGKVIHLSKEVGYPTIWSLEEFQSRDHYSCLIGGKRIRKN